VISSTEKGPLEGSVQLGTKVIEQVDESEIGVKQPGHRGRFQALEGTAETEQTRNVIQNQ
jgi:hypothetical protein